MVISRLVRDSGKKKGGGRKRGKEGRERERERRERGERGESRSKTIWNKTGACGRGGNGRTWGEYDIRMKISI